MLTYTTAEILTNLFFLRHIGTTVMKNNNILFVILLTISTGVFGQIKTFEDTVKIYFQEVESACRENEYIWNLDLYGPMLLVNQNDRTVFANMPDSANIFKKTKNIYVGVLPNEINIANTSLHWGGRDWAMIMLASISNDKNERLNLLTHELFHRVQRQLNFLSYNPSNNHLDKKGGRIYLQLELEALKKAVISISESDRINHLKAAVIFRKYRNSLFPSADSTENLLELNEGIAEYTGVMMSGRNTKQMQKHFVDRITLFLKSDSYIRSFSYETIPVYGYLLQIINKNWNKDINSQSNLTNYFIREFQLQLPNDVGSTIEKIKNRYNGKVIFLEEAERDSIKNKTITEYISKFIEQPHLTIPLENMNMSFDYTVIMPLENYGTVYPDIRVTDNWGILTVKKGSLISTSWDKITVSAPIIVDDEKLSGDGWTLELTNKYTVQKDRDGNYLLIK
jgi:hypothetical protein